MDTLQSLRKTNLFKDVPDAVLGLVAQAAEEMTFRAGETIVTENQPSDTLYLVRNGSARVTKGGTATPIVFGPGTSFGQAALLNGGPAGLSVVAAERVDLLAIRAPKLTETLAGNHEAAHYLYRAVARVLAARLRRVLDALVLAQEEAGSNPS